MTEHYIAGQSRVEHFEPRRSEQTVYVRTTRVEYIPTVRNIEADVSEVRAALRQMSATLDRLGVHKTPMPFRHGHCSSCDVTGAEEACWCCGSSWSSEM